MILISLGFKLWQQIKNLSRKLFPHSEKKVLGEIKVFLRPKGKEVFNLPFALFFLDQCFHFFISI